MDRYTAMRHFADSWGLLAMFAFFVGMLLFVFLRPQARRNADEAKLIPFKEDR